jgi:hypothetical protein
MNGYAITVKETGPLFDGRLSRALDRAQDDIERDIAKEGEQLIQERLGAVLRHPTGHYQRSIATREASGHHVITDGGVIYGPWLEGVGSRNRTTRFKGYRTFRTVVQELNKRAEHLADKAVSHDIGRLS